jgi:hypothetical protein
MTYFLFRLQEPEHKSFLHCFQVFSCNIYDKFSMLQNIVNSVSFPVLSSRSKMYVGRELLMLHVSVQVLTVTIQYQLYIQYIDALDKSDMNECCDVDALRGIPCYWKQTKQGTRNQANNSQPEPNIAICSLDNT